LHHHAGGESKENAGSVLKTCTREPVHPVHDGPIIPQDRANAKEDAYALVHAVHRTEDSLLQTKRLSVGAKHLYNAANMTMLQIVYLRKDRMRYGSDPLWVTVGMDMRKTV